jgi:hypothetical protein
MKIVLLGNSRDFIKVFDSDIFELWVGRGLSPKRLNLISKFI